LLPLICEVSWAQGELSLNNLSAVPRLHESGKAYDIQVRWTTDVPSVGRVEHGPTPQYGNASEPEAEPLRNHRLDLTDVPVAESRRVRVICAAGGKEVASEDIAIAPPKPFPQGNAERVTVPLMVRETEGVARKEPVTFGIPLPQGALGDARSIGVVDGGRHVPAEATALCRWPDGTIKWLLVDASVEIGARQTERLELRFGRRVLRPVGKAANVLTESEREIRFSTLAARFVVSKQTGEGGLFGGDRLDRLISRLPVSRLTATDGTVYLGKPERVEVERASPQTAVVKVTGHHVNAADEPYFGFVLRYFLSVGSAFVRVDHVLCHDMVSPGMKYGDEMKSFAALDLVFEPADATGSATLALEEGASATLPSGQRLFQHLDNQYALGSDRQGKRAPGLIQQGGLTVAVRDFWQQWPKSLASEKGKLIVGLCPTLEPKDRYANRPDEDVLYYCLRDGTYTFRSGFEKRHELLMGPSDALSREQALARANAPLVVTAEPKWYTSSGAVFDIAAERPAEFAMYDEILSDAVDAYVAVREQNHWYGLVNFGDWYGERGHNWGNIEYDLQHGLLTQYFRTGDRRFFVVAEQAARHNADVDVVHHAAGQVAGPGGPRRVGQAWVHSMCHTGGYYPSDYKGMSIYSQGYCENRGHMWSQGNLEYALLTGDAQVRRSALQLADWVCGPNTTDFSYGNARVPGWMGIIAMSTYFATYDEYYLNGMRLMYKEVQAKGDPKYGLWVHPLSSGHCDCEQKHTGEAGFMAGVLMTALKYLYLATGDKEVAERIVKIANFQVDHLWEPKEGGFRYTSCPKTGVTKTSAMIMANGLAFAANYANDERLRQVTREAFVNGLIAFKGAHGGKDIGYPICAAPLAIHEISRFPGPRFDEQLRELAQAALDPARRPLPSLVPNPDFEENLDGWRTRGLQFARSTEVAHTGRASARASGKLAKQNEYFVTYYACGAPWEIVWLEPGKRYRIQMWLRVDKLGAGVPAPTGRMALRSKGVTNTTFTSNAYDLTRPGTWQLLRLDFTVPATADAAYIAVDVRSQAEQEVLLYLDDVTLVPADAPGRETYAYPSASAATATLIGGLSKAVDALYKWEVVSSPDGQPGSATFKVDVPLGDQYRLLVRAQSPLGAATLPVQLDGKSVGGLTVGKSERWGWVELVPAGGELPRLDPGPHVVAIQWAAGQRVAVERICLTNELR
jgi:hypothetical protein